MEANLNKLDKYSVVILKEKWTIESGLHSGDVLGVWGRLELGLRWAPRRFFLTEVPVQVFASCSKDSLLVPAAGSLY